MKKKPPREIFDEVWFAWPKQPGNPKRDAKLPWFWFVDVGEAKSYLRMWWVWQIIVTVMFINVWFVHNEIVGFVLIPLTLGSQAALMRVWIPLCRRAQPPLRWRDWIAPGWFNPKARHCLTLAYGLVQDEQRPETAGP